MEKESSKFNSMIKQNLKLFTFIKKIVKICIIQSLVRWIVSRVGVEV